MISQQYHFAITTLYQAVQLPVPYQIESVNSLQIGDYVCHITEHPAGQLLMFVNIGNIEFLNKEALLATNMFSQELAKPVFSVDEKDKATIVWSRSSLMNSDRQDIYRQLELLTQALDQAQPVSQSHC